jgi:hypothetical protein
VSVFFVRAARSLAAADADADAAGGGGATAELYAAAMLAGCEGISRLARVSVTRDKCVATHRYVMQILSALAEHM